MVWTPPRLILQKPRAGAVGKSSKQLQDAAVKLLQYAPAQRFGHHDCKLQRMHWDY